MDFIKLTSFRVEPHWMMAILSILVCTVIDDGYAYAEGIEGLKQGVVIILGEGEACLKRKGSGLVVRQDASFIYITTASHVVRGCEKIGVQFYSQKLKLYPGKILSTEGGDDSGLAILTVPMDEAKGSEVTALPFNTEMPINSGDAITIIGFPKSTGVRWAVTQGEIIGRDGRSLKYSGLVDEGNSGGPLLKNGEVIGIVTQNQGNFSYAVPALIAQYVLESWGIKFGVALRSQPASIPLSYIAQMVKKNGFHHPADISKIGLSQSMQGRFTHDYEGFTFKGQKAIIDHTTQLMWEQFGSRKTFKRDEAGTYLKELNNDQFAGFKDWRLPTAEELASLLEPIGINERTYIHPLFFPLLWCWAADDVTVSEQNREGEFYFYDVPVYVNFAGGAIEFRLKDREELRLHVRAVRTFR